MMFVVHLRCVVRHNKELRVSVCPHNRLMFVRLDTLQRPDNFQVVFVFFVFVDDLLRRRMMLLIAHQYVVDQRSLARQETARHFERLAVHELRLASLDNRVDGRVFFHLHDETQLGRDSKVRDGEKSNFLEHKFSAELVLDARRRVDVLHRQRRDLHDVADVEAPDPVGLVQVAEQVPHVDFVEDCVEVVGRLVLLVSVGTGLDWLCVVELVERLFEHETFFDELVLELFDDRQQFDGRFCKQRRLRVVQKVNVFIVDVVALTSVDTTVVDSVVVRRAVMHVVVSEHFVCKVEGRRLEPVDVVLDELVDVFDEVVCNADSDFCVAEGFFVSVQLRQQGAYLHVRFAFVFELFEFFFGRVAEVFRKSRRNVHETAFEIQRALFERPDFLVSHGHVMKYCEHQELVRPAIFRG